MAYALVQKQAMYGQLLIHRLLCWQRPILPGSFPPSIFGTGELNFRVRDGNGWDLTVINTSLLHLPQPQNLSYLFLFTKYRNSLICCGQRTFSKKEPQKRFFFGAGEDLFYQAASRQVSSAQVSLTSVFGMGTGGASP